MKYLKNFYNILKQTINEFSDDRVMKLSASLTYYALFSLSPLILIIISGISLFLAKDTVEVKVFSELSSILGKEVSKALQDFVTNSMVSGDSAVALWIGVGVLIFGSTTMFADMQDSLNTIWRIEATPHKAWLKFIVNRCISLLIILSVGLLLMTTVILNSILVNFGEEIFEFLKIDEFVTQATVILINNTLTAFLSVMVFFILFKVLPDANVKFKPAMVGSIFTATLFFISKYLIGIYIANTKYSKVFGSAGSLVILLLWIYYISTILFLGAKFTKVYAEHIKLPIKPKKNAKQKEIKLINNTEK